MWSRGKGPCHSQQHSILHQSRSARPPGVRYPPEHHECRRVTLAELRQNGEKLREAWAEGERSEREMVRQMDVAYSYLNRILGVNGAWAPERLRAFFWWVCVG